MSEMLHGSSGFDEIQTPRELLDRLYRAFRFDYDAFASHDNAYGLCQYYSTMDGTFHRSLGKVSDSDGLASSWEGMRTFMNPPYSRGLVEKCVDKAIAERNNAAIIVALIKVDTSTRWWQKLAAVSHIDYLPKRVKYVHPNPPPGWAGASFPSAIVILKKDWLS